MYVYVKRGLDFALSLLALIVLSFVFLLVAIAVKIDSSGPVFFRQTRVGKDKKNFNMLKFRTMRTDAPRDVPTHLLRDPNAYITRVGRILRKTSLDELPQLLHMLRGEMSVVGPRPALWNQDDLIAARDEYRGRFGLTANQLRPGLTGWAQINGRDELSVAEKAAYDGDYARRVSFAFDCKIFFLTFARVFRKSGVREGSTV